MTSPPPDTHYFVTHVIPWVLGTFFMLLALVALHAISYARRWKDIDEKELAHPPPSGQLR